jgi:hypothetical protein
MVRRNFRVGFPGAQNQNMKSFLLKLVPGAVFTAAVLAIGAFSMLHAQSKTEPVTSPGPQTVTVSQPGTVLVCGHCGEYLQQPQTVLVALPVRQLVPQGGNGYGRSFYGMPPVVQAYPAGYYPDGASCGYYAPPMPRQNVFGMSPQLPACQFPAPVGRVYYQPQACRY